METELHDRHLEELFLEEFGIELPKASSAPSRKRTFDRERKASSQGLKAQEMQGLSYLTARQHSKYHRRQIRLSRLVRHLHNTWIRGFRR